MMPFDAKDILLAALAGLSIWFILGLVTALRSRDRHTTAGQLATGFITNFFDTLGIGSFAPTTAIFRRWRLVPDEEIPGTLHAGHTIPSIVQAFIFTKLVKVGTQTLVLMIPAAVGGP